MAMLRGPNHVFEFANPAYSALIGGRDVVGRSVAEALPDAAAQGYVEVLDRVYRTGEAHVAQGSLFSVQSIPGGPIVDRYVDFVFQPVRNTDGAVTGLFIDGSDVTERIRQIKRQVILADLGERLRKLHDISEVVRVATESLVGVIDCSRIGFGSVDPDNETVLMHPETCAPGIESIAGTHAFRTFGSFIDDLNRGEMVVIQDVRKDPRTAANADQFAQINIGAMLNLPVIERGRFVLVVFVHHDGPYRWTEDELWLLRQVGDRTQAAIAQIEAEVQQGVLNQELSHRLKNTLTMVQAIASQTLRGVSERDAVDAFNKRIHALSTAHDVLLQRSWSTAPIRAIAAAVLATFDRSDCIDIEGPDVTLGARSALYFSLLVHELGTNAVKYGSLSAMTGRVRFRWWLEGQTGHEDLVMSWTETGGPTVSEPPSARGFGSRLIRMGLLGTGGVETDYEPEGLVVRLRAPLSQVQRS
nr:HWE histidine kinase domain-containing protein [Jiella flava]